MRLIKLIWLTRESLICSLVNFINVENVVNPINLINPINPVNLVNLPLEHYLCRQLKNEYEQQNFYNDQT